MSPLRFDHRLPQAMDYHREGQLEQADELYAELSRDVSDIAHVVYLRGLLAHQRGRHDLTVFFARQAATLAPENAEYHNLVGVGCYHCGRLEEATASYRQAVKCDPLNAGAWGNLSLVLIDCGLFTAAEEAARRCVELSPLSANAHNGLGMAQVSLGHALEAEASFRRALAMAPHEPDTHRNLANVLKELGRFDEAWHVYRQLLDFNPRDGVTLNHLVHCRRVTPGEAEQLQAYAPLTVDLTLAAEDRAAASYALGKVNEDTSHYDAAFAYYQHANDLLRGAYNRPGVEATFDELIEYFTSLRIESRAGQGSPSERMIFVVGMFRSGTTLVEQILASHEHVYGAGELTDIECLVRDLPQLSDSDLPFPQCLNKVSPAQIRQLAEDYLARRQRTSSSALRVVDKMPGNYRLLGLISILFPNARIIHCRRDPRDVCFSIFANRFTSPPAYAFDLADAAHYYRQHDRLMSHWNQVLPQSMLTVQYEDLVNAQESVTRQILDFCDLPWSDRCLRFHETTRHVTSASDWQVRQPLYGSSVGRWQHFSQHLGPLFAELGMAPQLATAQ